MMFDLRTILQFVANMGKKPTPPASPPYPRVTVTVDTPPAKIGFLADLFAGHGNTYWDLGRIIAWFVIFSVVAIQVWAIILGQLPDIMALGGALAAVVTASAVLIAAKDFSNPANRKAPSTVETIEVAGDVNVSGEQK